MSSTSPETIFLSALMILTLGYIARKSGLVSREQGGVIAKIVLNVTLPALILQTVPQIQLTPDLLFLPLLAFAHAGVSFAVVQLLFRRRDPMERGVITICAMGFNNGLFAFPIVQEIWGIEAIKLLAMFDVGNGLVILGINYVVAAYFSAGKKLQLGETLKIVGKTLITSVPMVTFAVGLVLNLTELQLPAPAARAVNSVASANGALALLVLGIYQSLRVPREELPTIVKLLSLRYLIGAIFVVGAVTLLGETLMLRRVLSIAFILPIGMTVIPISVRFGFNTRLATTMVNLTIVVSFLLMWLAALFVQ